VAKKKKITRKKSKKLDRSQSVEYDYHLPVLLNESISLLINNRSGIYIDGTLGGGSHSNEILNQLNEDGILLSFDKDPDAIHHCNIKFNDELKKENPRIKLINKSYGNFTEELKSLHHKKESAKHWGMLSGLLLDLGVSSHQLDSINRGISYRFDSPLDMRFGVEGLSAKEIVHAADEEKIEHILKTYGEEPFSRVIARRIIERRRAGTLETSNDLKEIILDSVPVHLQIKSLSRVFQAFRIFVNSELEILSETITNAVPMLEKGGRIVVISYHSLEDRIVKNLFKEFCKKSRPAIGEELVKSNTVKINPIAINLTPNPIKPNKEELLRNPRSRSAIMRAIEKT